jgi:translocation and assembly module TamB
MTPDTPQTGWRWLRHIAWTLGVCVALAIAGVVIFLGSGAGNPLIRRLVISRLEAMTGSRAELAAISIQWLSLGATLRGFVIHGREPADTEPLFAADELRIRMRIDSFWGRKIALDQLFVNRPRVHIRVQPNGSSNLPVLSARSGQKKPLSDSLFDLHVRRVQLENGWILYNNVRTPLAVEASNLHLALDASGPADRPLYLGTLDCQSMNFTAKKFLPIPISIAAKFTVSQNGFALEQGVFSAAHSHLDAQAELRDFAQPKWSFRYRGWLTLLDLREILRSPDVPTGHVDVRGEGTLVAGQLRSTGSYSGQEITLTYLPIFHAAGLSSRSTFRMDNKGIELPDFLTQAFGGTVKGKVTLRFEGLLFRADTHLQEVRLAGVLAAIEHRGFPIDELHWDSLITADTVETWTGAFNHFEIFVKMQWSSPENVAAGHVPVEGNWQFRYRYDPSTLAVDSGEFETPATRGAVTGLLDPRNTALDVHFETGSLEAYRDFINAIREAAPDSPDAVKVIAGNVRWDGKIVGPSGRPVFVGHVRGESLRYENWTLDSVEGELSYSPVELSLTHGRLQRGAIDAEVELSLFLTDWSFLPENAWSADVNFDATPLEALQQLFGTSYPARGLLSGQFHGRGTRSDPSFTGLFDLAEGDVYGVVFHRLRGQLNLNGGEVRVVNAELRLFAPGKEAGRGAGIVTGSAGYKFADQNVSVDLVGASIPLANFERLQTPRFPVDGLVTFRLKANGPATSVQADGTLRVVDLRVGQSVIGSFDGELNSDGRTAQLKISSAMTTGEISGTSTLGLSEPFPLQGKLSIKNIDLDPLLLAALHAEKFSGHSKADGEITVNGSLRQPSSIVVDANFSRLAFEYAKVQLENAGPIHFLFSRENLQVESATFRGTDTNIQIDGKVQFANRRTVNLRLNGALDLRLLSGFVPQLSAGGPAEINALFEGPLDRPGITGRIHIEKAYARFADFPMGLTAIRGDFIFDATRLYFDNLTAEAGGGTLRLSGSVSYTERPVRYDITARSDSTRIRYPEGMSWLTAGSLHLTGTSESGLLAGRVTVERVILTQGLEVAGALVSTKEGISSPSTSSPFLRNLQFDVEAVSTPDARMQWPGAELEAEASLRVRGTWEHPIILGHIHVLAGDLLFHGNRYRVARGDINFANPFRLDPVVNVEANTQIQQYEITLNFTGPASKLTLAYRSDPPLPGNDIVTLLALGQTSAEGTTRTGGTTQSATSGASAILSEAVSSQLGGRLEKLFGITNFRVDPGLTGVGSTGAGQNAAARVTVQQQVTRNITVTYVSNVGSTQQQVIQVEYNVNRNISIVALRDYNGTFGIDVKIKKRFP